LGAGEHFATAKKYSSSPSGVITNTKRLGVDATVAKAVRNVAGQDRGGTSGNGPALISDMQLITTFKNIKDLKISSSHEWM
jgi:hypothetical protein